MKPESTTEEVTETNADVIQYGDIKRDPAVPINESILTDRLVCLECGQEVKSLVPHLKKHAQNAESYRTKWELPDDYPITAPRECEGKTATDDTQNKKGLLENSNKDHFDEIAHSAEEAAADIMIEVELVHNGMTQVSAMSIACLYQFAFESVKLQNRDSDLYEQIHSNLPDWDEIKVKNSANPYYRPVKWAFRNLLDEYPASKLSNMATVFREAAESDPPIHFTDFPYINKNNGGIKTWADKIASKRKKKKKGNPPAKNDSENSSNKQETTAKEPPLPPRLPKRKAASTSKAAAKTEPTKDPIEELGCDDKTQPFPAELSLVAWDKSKLENIMDTLQTLPGFVSVVDCTSERAKNILENCGNA